MKSNTNKQAIAILAIINAPVEKVWEVWTNPEHITQWCAASDDWHAPYADNDLKTGGKFRTTMAAKDGSFSFEFEGIYSNVEHHRRIEYTMSDGRRVSVLFNDKGNNQTEVTETFDPEDTHSPEMQREGWQSILNNFKKYTESQE